MKTVSRLVIAVSLALSSLAAVAEDSLHGFSANLALSTDYRFRGISQTGKDPSVSGGFDYSYTPYGLYAGVWASNLDFGVPDPDPASLEIDFYGGIAGETAAGIGWDVGATYYFYPGSDTGPGVADYDFVEVYGAFTYDFGYFDSGISVAYSPDYFFESGDAVYLSGDVGIPLPAGFSLAGHLGYQTIDDNAQFGTPDYLDWSIGVARDINMFTFDLSYIDTDLGRAGCFGGGNICKSTVLFTISANF